MKQFFLKKQFLDIDQYVQRLVKGSANLLDDSEWYLLKNKFYRG